MKKLLCAVLAVIMVIMLAACVVVMNDPDTSGSGDESSEAAPDGIVEMLIREGNALYKKGEEEAAQLVFERAVKLMNAKINSPEEFLVSVNLDEKLSDQAREMLASYYMMTYDGAEEKPSLPEGYDWGNK